MELNFEGLEMLRFKNRVICLVIRFNSGVMVIKMSKMAQFSVA